MLQLWHYQEKRKRSPWPSFCIKKLHDKGKCKRKQIYLLRELGKSQVLFFSIIFEEVQPAQKI